MLEVKNIIIPVLFCIFLSSCTSVGKKNEERTVREYHPIRKNRIEEPPPEDKKIFGKLDPLIEKYWGANYKIGAEGPALFDCSGFVKRIFSEAYNYNLPRSSKEQFATGDPVNMPSLEYADLVFFSTNGRNTVSHVGVYIGNGKFAHASASVGVTITALDGNYYKERYLGARRILK